MPALTKSDFLYDKVSIHGLVGELSIVEIDYDGRYKFTLMVTDSPETQITVGKDTFSFTDAENETFWEMFIAQRAISAT